ncbi:unnamed protein product [Urochloa humidicola]
METPVFTVELDVSHGSSYGGFITGVRNQLVLHAGATRHLDLVLLRPQEEDPKKAPWFGVTLRHSSGDSVLLRIRADNLYISGYRSPAGRWWEFRGGGSAIGNATQLPFTDSYGSMGNAAGLALEGVTLGKEELAAAAGANNAGGSEQDTARSLMVIAVMVSEAIRFRSVAGVLAHIMCNPGRRGPLPAHMVKQVKNWSSLSERWIGAVLYGQPFGQPLGGAAGGSQQPSNNIPQHLLAPAKIDCQDDAMAALGVLLNRQGLLQEKHQQELDEHWRAVRAQARKLDRERS